MLITLEGMVTFVSPEQDSNALPSIISTPLDMVMEDRFEQLSNALYSMVFTLDGIITLVSPVQL